MGPSLLIYLTLVISSALADSTTVGNLTDFSKVCEAECRRCEVGAVGRGRCLSQCPSYKGVGSPCKPPKKFNEFIFQVSLGCAVGVFLCMMFGVGGLLCARARHRRRDSLPKTSPKALKSFHRELDRFRPHAYTFLAILNNVRRQVREMHRAGNTDAAVICGRSLSDLAKILMLLNRRDIPIVPPDWPRLASWAERLLERTSLVVPPPQPQVAQLVQFLQSPQKPHNSVHGQTTHMTMLKPPAYEATVRNQDSTVFEDVSFKPEWSQQWEMAQESTARSGDDAWQSRSEVRQNNLWLDDDFFLISFRPQDEIVTVL